MVAQPSYPKHITSIPSSADIRRTNELANFVPPYCTFAYSTPPTLNLSQASLVQPTLAEQMSLPILYLHIVLLHIALYLLMYLQLEEAGSIRELKVRLFSLSLTGTIFLWFTSLAPNSISLWEQLE